MPTYTYRCASCAQTFDKVQRITEDPIRVCVYCGAEAASRLILQGNFMLKGSGWYGDLYAGSSNKKSTGSDAPSSASSSSASSSTSSSPSSSGTSSSPSSGSTPSNTSSPSSSGGGSSGGGSSGGGASSA